MKRLPVLFALLALAACQQQQGDAAALKKAEAEVARLEKENSDLVAEKAKAKPTMKKATSDEGQPMDDYDEATLKAADKVEANYRRTLCWQDYCPCESPETALDTTICRNARGGVEMSDEQWAIGAQARDSKREGDRLNREMDDIISDMRTKRY